MRFSRVAMVYFVMGAVMFGAGVVPYNEVGLVSVFVDNPAENDGEVAANESAVMGGEDAENPGILDNLIGPIRNALGTIAGGSLLAVWGAIDAFLGFWAWPLTVTKYINAPWEMVLVSAALPVGFTFGVLRVFRGSI